MPIVLPGFRHTQFLFMLILLRVAALAATASSSARSSCCHFLEFQNEQPAVATAAYQQGRRGLGGKT